MDIQLGDADLSVSFTFNDVNLLFMLPIKTIVTGTIISGAIC